jgi:hypothetical protein
MSDFDDFLKRRNVQRSDEQEKAQKQQQREAHIEALLKGKALTEWQNLTVKIRGLIEGKDIDGTAITEQGNSFCLKHVAATLNEGMIVDGVPRNLRIVFGRKSGHYMDDSRMETQVWAVEPFVLNEEISWQVIPGKGRVDVNTEGLASKVLQNLVSYCDAFEASYGR